MSGRRHIRAHLFLCDAGSTTIIPPSPNRTVAHSICLSFLTSFFSFFLVMPTRSSICSSLLMAGCLLLVVVLGPVRALQQTLPLTRILDAHGQTGDYFGVSLNTLEGFAVIGSDQATRASLARVLCPPTTMTRTPGSGYKMINFSSQEGLFLETTLDGQYVYFDQPGLEPHAPW